MTTLAYTEYRLTEKTETTAAGKITSYGISAYDENGKEILSIDDITCDKGSLAGLIEICNTGKLSSLHIKDVVEDYIIGK